MWKASAGHNITSDEPDENDDWETDADFVNDVTEHEQRWGSKTVDGSGRKAGAINMLELRQETEQADANKKKQLLEKLQPGFGYGGKYGIETDRMDKSAMGHDYIGKVEKHGSQKDYSDGFGGKFGIQEDRVDKSAVRWDHKESVEKHSSQKDYSTGFGGKFGVQKDRIDKSAVGWDHIEKVEKHESQKDYNIGFGGKFGVQNDRKDKSALGWDHIEAPQKHESQVDHKIGFGGKFGIQNDRMDKSALGFQENQSKIGTSYDKIKPDIGTAKPSNIRAKFENLAKSNDDENLKKIYEQRRLREIKNRSYHEEAIQKKSVISNEVTPDTAVSNIRPDVIPNQIDEHIIYKPPAEFGSDTAIIENRKEIYSNIEQTTSQQVISSEPNSKLIQNTIASNVKDSNEITEVNQAVEDQAEYIEDTGLRAIALYDYQAAADDEISFDPDDIITHIEQIDQGWWRGMCKNKYGLFPANYVQLHYD